MAMTVQYGEYFMDKKKYLGTVFGSETEIRAMDTAELATGFAGLAIDSGRLLMFSEGDGGGSWTAWGEGTAEAET